MHVPDQEDMYTHMQVWGAWSMLKSKGMDRDHSVFAVEAATLFHKWDANSDKCVSWFVHVGFIIRVVCPSARSYLSFGYMSNLGANVDMFVLFLSMCWCRIPEDVMGMSLVV